MPDMKKWTLSFLVILIVYLLVGKNKTKGGKAEAKNTAKKPVNKTYSSSNKVNKKEAALSDKPPVSKKGKRDYELRDDIGNDWLSRQLAEEERAFHLVSKMFDLKYNSAMDHSKDCDAKRIREEHFDNCDAKEVKSEPSKSTMPNT
ncbi:MAG: hypothetical protein K5931_11095 [Lachnospiraceae bacterium]|nr:hypothetical protein [Lachnospiraceae bacterium]